MRLTSEQIRFFDTFGFLKLPALFKDEMDEITEEFESILSAHQHDGTKRTVVDPFIDKREKLSRLLDDPRIEGIFASLLGDDFNYRGSDGNYYAGNTRWHRDSHYYLGQSNLPQDRKYHKYRFIKLAFYLDKVGASTGALSVIPGSHRIEDQFSMDVAAYVPDWKHNESFKLEGSEIPAYVIDVVPGDALIFDFNIMHSSWGGGSKRRMFTINACHRFSDDDIDLLKEVVDEKANLISDTNYDEIMVKTAGPKRMIHLEQMMQLDKYKKELSDRMRQKNGIVS